MQREEAIKHMTDVMAKFVAFTGKRLPDDVRAKIEELAQQEEEPLAKAIYKTMERNQELALKLNRPSCQDTGALQFFIKCGTEFPYMAELPELLRQAVVQATKDGRCATMLSRPLMSTIRARTWPRTSRLFSGTLHRAAMTVRSTPTWRAAAVHCRATPRS